MFSSSRVIIDGLFLPREAAGGIVPHSGSGDDPSECLTQEDRDFSLPLIVVADIAFFVAWKLPCCVMPSLCWCPTLAASFHFYVYESIHWSLWLTSKMIWDVTGVPSIANGLCFGLLFTCTSNPLTPCVWACLRGVHCALPSILFTDRPSCGSSGTGQGQITTDTQDETDKSCFRKHAHLFCHICTDTIQQVNDPSVKRSNGVRQISIIMLRLLLGFTQYIFFNKINSSHIVRCKNW